MNETTNSGILWHDRKRTFLGLPWSFTKYQLTDDRLFIKTGFFRSVEDEVRLYRIMDLSLTRTLGQKLFRLGTISCSSADKTLGDFQIKNIKHSKEIKELLSQKVEEERSRKRVSGREFMSDGHDGMGDQDDFSQDN